MTLAELQALRLGHVTVEPEHVLLGLAEEWEGVAGNVLKDLGATYKRLSSDYSCVSNETASEGVEGVVTSSLQRRREAGHEFTGCVAVCLGFLAGKTD
jgi:ATP-dependent Clp protease ATP-binding subunit ClpA